MGRTAPARDCSNDPRRGATSVKAAVTIATKSRAKSDVSTCIPGLLLFVKVKMKTRTTVDQLLSLGDIKVRCSDSFIVRKVVEIPFERRQPLLTQGGGCTSSPQLRKFIFYSLRTKTKG